MSSRSRYSSGVQWAEDGRSRNKRSPSLLCQLPPMPAPPLIEWHFAAHRPQLACTPLAFFPCQAHAERAVLRDLSKCASLPFSDYQQTQLVKPASKVRGSPQAFTSGSVGPALSGAASFRLGFLSGSSAWWSRPMSEPQSKVSAASWNDDCCVVPPKKCARCERKEGEWLTSPSGDNEERNHQTH